MTTFTNDASRNVFFKQISEQSNLPNSLEYVDGVLYQNGILVTDTDFVKTMDQMFEAFTKLSNTVA